MKPNQSCLKCENKTLDWYCGITHHEGGFLKKIENKNKVPTWCPKWIAFKELAQKLKDYKYDNGGDNDEGYNK